MLRLEVTTNIEPEKLEQDLEKFATISESKLLQIVKAIQAGNVSNVERGLLWTGGAVEPLAQSTIRAKGFSRPLFETGTLAQSVIYKKESKDVYNIFISANRSDIAYWLVTGTRKMPSRDFFGISNEVDKQIDEILLEEEK